MATVTFEIVDLDGGDVLAVVPTIEEAREGARAFVEDHEDIAEDIVVLEIDAKGERVGEPIQALALLDPSLSY